MIKIYQRNKDTYSRMFKIKLQHTNTQISTKYQYKHFTYVIKTTHMIVAVAPLSCFRQAENG